MTGVLANDAKYSIPRYKLRGFRTAFIEEDLALTSSGLCFTQPFPSCSEFNLDDSAVLLASRRKMLRVNPRTWYSALFPQRDLRGENDGVQSLRLSINSIEDRRKHIVRILLGLESTMVCHSPLRRPTTVKDKRRNKSTGDWGPMRKAKQSEPANKSREAYLGYSSSLEAAGREFLRSRRSKVQTANEPQCAANALAVCAPRDLGSARSLPTRNSLKSPPTNL
ncbi:hypothetical protein K438DRAFT_2113413 [Mycena galopus ATCC 62051]|nr:hypothetical protein K438DRAFT_2113413 [Mycena galopus ATCC 62051]